MLAAHLALAETRSRLKRARTLSPATLCQVFKILQWCSPRHKPLCQDCYDRMLSAKHDDNLAEDSTVISTMSLKSDQVCWVRPCFLWCMHTWSGCHTYFSAWAAQPHLASVLHNPPEQQSCPKWLASPYHLWDWGEHSQRPPHTTAPSINWLLTWAKTESWKHFSTT